MFYLFAEFSIQVLSKLSEKFLRRPLDYSYLRLAGLTLRHGVFFSLDCISLFRSLIAL